MATRKPRKPKNVIAFPKGRQVRAIAHKGVDVSSPYEQFEKSINLIIERDGVEETFHKLAEIADKLRRILAKEMFMRNSG